MQANGKSVHRDTTQTVMAITVTGRCILLLMYYYTYCPISYLWRVYWRAKSRFIVHTV